MCSAAGTPLDGAILNCGCILGCLWVSCGCLNVSFVYFMGTIAYGFLWGSIRIVDNFQNQPCQFTEKKSSEPVWLI